MAGMEEEAWAWLDEDFRLDTGSPFAISHSLWDDFTSSEGVVRSLFPVSHAEYLASPALSLEKTESSEHSSNWDVVPDCGPSPFKRRCLLQFYGNEDRATITSSTSGSLENNSENFVGTREIWKVDEPSSPNSMWYNPAEESHSSADDAMHRSAESWVVGCLSDSDTSDVVEIPPPPPHRSDMHSYAADSKISMARPKGSALKSRRSFKAAAPPKVASPSSKPIQVKDIPEKAQIQRRAHGKTSQSLVVRESARPVLAYPFALVKPSGIQGDVTLQDINQRIKMAISAASPVVKSSFKSSASPLSGRSVVALTKIQTEGKGTITILRTRS